MFHLMHVKTMYHWKKSILARMCGFCPVFGFHVLVSLIKTVVNFMAPVIASGKHCTI